MYTGNNMIDCTLNDRFSQVQNGQDKDDEEDDKETYTSHIDWKGIEEKYNFKLTNKNHGK